MFTSDLDCLGANIEIGANTEKGIGVAEGLATFLPIAGGLTTGIADTVEQAKKEKQLSADQASALKSMLEADKTAATAVATADFSEKQKLPRAALDRKAADLALNAQKAAAANPKLSADASAARAEAAQKEQRQALALAQAATTDIDRAQKTALVEAWTKVMNMANNATATKQDSAGGGAPKSDGESFLTKKVIGPVPVWGAGLGAIAAGLLAKKYLGK